MGKKDIASKSATTLDPRGVLHLLGRLDISELAEGHIKHPGDVLKKEQVATARIIRINAEQRQLGLSLKQVASDQYMASDLGLPEEMALATG